MQTVLSRLWTSWDITLVAVVGHSLGEHTALNVAGVLSDADTVYLAGIRAWMLEEKCTQCIHSMLVVKVPLNDITAVLKKTNFEAACINSPNKTVIAGLNEDVSVFQSLLAAAGMKSTLLKVPYSFHSSQMDAIIGQFEKLAAGVTYAKPKLPVLCSLDGSAVIDKAKFGPHYLARHCREIVNFRAALAAANSEKIITDQTITLEIGPHPTISGMIKDELPHVTSLVSMQRGRPPFRVLAATLTALNNVGAEIRWAEYHRDSKASQNVISLPAYSSDLKDYWIQYVNYWSLHKGEPPIVINAGNTLNLESTTIHSVIEESSDTDKAHIVIEVDVTLQGLSPLV